ncbi:hypothetical protein [Flavobacterium sp.]|uniref:hypothetical protein n=1 Tax=Flavobacterium sp. TaxID=239 RepID=UPI00286A3244|nr:hypothetical protein [Flavobacterium sp.]
MILIVIIAIEFAVYYSDFNLVNDKTLEIGTTTLIVFVIFIFVYIKKWRYKILLVLPTLAFGIIFLGLEIIGIIAGSEKISWKWKIGEYEVIYANMEYYAGPEGRQYLKLRKNYFFDQFYKTLDKQKTENTFLELGIGKNNCDLKFEKTGMEFDLCEKKQLK